MRAVMHSSSSVNGKRRPGTHDGRPFQRGVVVRKGPTKLPRAPSSGTTCTHCHRQLEPGLEWARGRQTEEFLCRACQELFQNVHGRIERCRLQQTGRYEPIWAREQYVCFLLLLLLLSLFMIILMAFVALDATFNSHGVGPT
jgi:hypothetical protein